MIVALDLELLAKVYFYFDKPVEYRLKDKNTIKINPISVKQSEIFLTSADILNIDKNASGSVEIIQMPYLQFICGLILSNEPQAKTFQQKLVNILGLCLGMNKPRFIVNEQNDKIELTDDEIGVRITHKDFDDIKRIIMYQNIIHFDDEYVNPELKQAMAEVDSLRNKTLIPPNLERKMAIITARTGLTKEYQEKMAYRAHSLLFEELCGDVDYSTKRPIALYAGKDSEVQWIFKKEKNKFDGYITDADKYTNSMGNGSIKSTVGDAVGNNLDNQFSSFNK